MPVNSRSADRNEAIARFHKIKKLYQLEDPTQIKMRILWMATKQIALKAFGDTPANRKILLHYDAEWKTIERYESINHAVVANIPGPHRRRK